MLDAFQTRLAEAEGLDELMDALEETLTGMGFTGFIYWTHIKKPLEELSDSEAFYLSRGLIHLKTLEALYFSRKLYRDDPAAKLAPSYTVPFTSAEARERSAPTTRKRWIYALEQRFGFKYDINIPVHTPLRTQVLNAYCIGSDAALGQMIQDNLPTLRGIANAFAATVVDFVIVGSEDKTADIFLSRRQQECLAWMAKGRSNREIAEILECSEATVKFHVSGLLERLHAANRAEAIAIAARHGWIVN